MPRVRRTGFLLVRLAERQFLDVEGLLEGELRLESEPELLGASALRGGERALSRDELDLLLSIPSDRYVEVADERVGRLARHGFVLIEGGDEDLEELRRRDERLSQVAWHPYAAVYHALTRWRDVESEVPPSMDDRLLDHAVEEFVARYGPPPAHFHAFEKTLDVRPLPLPHRDDGLFATLRRRRTSRGFDRARFVDQRELATLLYETFGAQGYAPIADDLAVLRKTSPSGGGLHPIEAYPLVIDVVGLEPGLYHYSVEGHALELIEQLERVEARKLSVRAMCGQTWFGDAGVLVVLAARFDRSFWKYRDSERAFGVLLMDAGHLSQTFYLVCAELGLGAFVTAAINAATIDERLGLDGFGQGALAIVGCGRPADRRSALEPAFAPYVPRETHSDAAAGP
jgi:putative peptide maturation dehydrogenase